MTFEDSLLEAYRAGATGDFVQGMYDGVWGALWVVPRSTSIAQEKVGQRFTRGRSSRIRHYHRAMLRMRMLMEPLLVMVETELPGRRQRVSDIQTGIEVKVPVYLEDAALSALESAFVATPSPSSQQTAEVPLNTHTPMRKMNAKL